MSSNGDPFWAILMIHVAQAFYAFFWWLNQPVLPYLSKELGADPVVFGYFQSVSSFAMLVGAPFVGRVIDSKGPKTALVVSHLAGVMCYFLLATATSVPLLFLSQIPTLFLAGMHSSQAYISLVSDESRRAASLGRLSMSYGVGFVLGPWVGGSLAEVVGYHGLALTAGVGSACVAACVWVFLPEARPAAGKPAAAAPSNQASVETNGVLPSDTREGEEGRALPVAATITSNSDSKEGLNVAAIMRLLAIRDVRSGLAVQLLVGVAVSAFRSSATIIMKETHALSPQDLGRVLSGIGVIMILTNSVGVGFITARLSEDTTVTASLAVMSALFAALLLAAAHLAVMPVAGLLAGTVPLIVAGATLSSVLVGMFTKRTKPEDAGTVLGLAMAVNSASRVIAPVLSGYLLTRGLATVAGVCASGCALALLINLLTFKSSPAPDRRKQD